MGDPAVYWMWSTTRGQNYRIDADRYRVLTYELSLPGARNVLGGSIARVIWKIAEESGENVSQDIVVNHRAGANVFAKVIADMKTLELETDPGGSPSTTGWVNGGGSNPGINNFRIDPLEFAAATAFAYRRVKLAAFERAGDLGYAINWSFSNPSAVATTLTLVADLDRQGCDGISIATGLNPAPGPSPGARRLASPTVRRATSARRSWPGPPSSTRPTRAGRSCATSATRFRSRGSSPARGPCASEPRTRAAPSPRRRPPRRWW